MEVIRKIGDPKSRSHEALEEHWIGGHTVFHDWCEVCIQARGKEDPHERASGKDRRFPEYSYDYCFPGDEIGYKWTVLVGKERSCGSWMASTVPR